MNDNNMTFDECKKLFTDIELQQLQEAGQHVIMQSDFFAFNADVPEALLEKFDIVFSHWIGNQRQGKTSVEIIKAYLDFIQGLGIEVHIEEPAPTRRNFPRVIFDIENAAQFLPTHKKYFGALLPQKNKYAYIAKFDRQLQFDDQGNITVADGEDDIMYNELTKTKVIPAKCADTDLLMTLASAVEASYRSSRGYTVTVYLPKFAEAMGVQFETEGKDQKHYDIKGKMTELENIIGVLVEQKKIQFAFKIIEFDQERKELTFASKYLYSVMELLSKDPKVSKERKDNKPVSSFLQESHLISSKINQARNKSTTQIIYYIITKLHWRGIKPDAKLKPQKQHTDARLITTEIKYSDIIKNAPLLKESMQEAEPKRRSQILVRAILGDAYNRRTPQKNQTPLVEQYLREYTDAFSYWTDLTIEVEPVSMKELDNRIILRHHGLNGEFDSRLQIPRIDESEDMF